MLGHCNFIHCFPSSYIRTHTRCGWAVIIGYVIFVLSRTVQGTSTLFHSTDTNIHESPGGYQNSTQAEIMNMVTMALCDSV